MSYSRWIHSRWYTYWHAGGGRTRDDQYFDVCAVKGFTSRELKDDLEGCLNKAREESPNVTEEEMLELKGYMQEFLADVESDQDLIYYEKLKEGIIEDIEEFMAWYIDLRDSDLKDEISEAIKVLNATNDDVPLLVGEIESDIGKALIEKRLKGALAQLGERQAGSLKVDGSIPSSSNNLNKQEDTMASITVRQ